MALGGERLKDVSPAYAIAAEAFQLAVAHEAGKELQADLWKLVEREAKKAERVP